MRILAFSILATVISASLLLGCSKNSHPQSQAGVPLLTQSPLQRQFQDQEARLQSESDKLAALRKTSPTNDPVYVDEQAKLAELIKAHRILYAKVEAEKIDAQLKAAGHN